MADDPDPPRKFYELKPRDFERVNAARPEPEPPPSSVPPATPVTERIEVRELYRDASVPGPVLAKGPRPGAENEVTAILRDNLARESAAGLHDDPDWKPRKSRRFRDYMLLMVTLNGGLGVLAYSGFHSGNTVLFVYCIAGMGFFSAGITWLMWFLMDKY